MIFKAQVYAADFCAFFSQFKLDKLTKSIQLFFEETLPDKLTKV